MPFNDRDQLWHELESGAHGHWDVIIAGGGITGSGILREAVRRGYKSLLIEQRDFAWGSSSRSSKMVHGGLRYLAAGDISLTRHALQEREKLIAEAPRLVRRLGYYFPLYKGEFPPRFAAGALFWLYDKLAGVNDHRRIDNAQLQEAFSSLETGSLNGAFYYTDAVTDDARLTLRVLHESVKKGGYVRNYTKGTKLLYDNGKACGLRIKDMESGRKLELQARVVINATGAWADRFRDKPPKGIRIRPQRGSHLVLSSEKFPVPQAIFIRHREDGRRLFIYPWESRTIVGTTDIPHEENLDQAASISAAELAYLLQATEQLFPARPARRDDVIASWSGVRPIIIDGDPDDPSGASREHQVWSEPGLVGCSGGKLTTFHHMARDVIGQAEKYLPDADPFNDERIFTAVKEDPDLVPGNAEMSERLIGRYGAEAETLVAAGEEGESLPLPDTHTCLAELRWSLQNESVVHLDDLMLRRSRLGILLRAGGSEVLDQIRPLCQDRLGWDQARWSDEVGRYLNVIDRFYSIPPCES